MHYQALISVNLKYMNRMDLVMYAMLQSYAIKSINYFDACLSSKNR